MARKYLPMKHKCYKGLPNTKYENLLMAQEYAIICTPILQTMRRDQQGAAAQPSHSFPELCRLAELVMALQPDGVHVQLSINQQIQSLPASVISDFSGPDVPHVVWSPRRDRAACRCGEISVRLRKILEAL